MEGILDLIDDNDWVVRYKVEHPHGLIENRSIPLSRFNKIMYNNTVDFKSAKIKYF